MDIPLGRTWPRTRSQLWWCAGSGTVRPNRRRRSRSQSPGGARAGPVLRRALTRPLEFVLAAQADANGIDAYEQRAALQTVMAAMRRLRSPDREVLLDYLCKNAGCAWEYDNGSRQLRVRFQAP